MLSPDWIDLGLKVVNLAGTAIIGAYVWLARRDQVSRDQMAALEGRASVRMDGIARSIEHLDAAVDGRLDTIAGRLVVVETRQATAPAPAECHAMQQRVAKLEASCPGKSDIERIHTRIDGVAGDVAGIRGELHGVKGLLTTIDQYLREHPHRA